MTRTKYQQLQPEERMHIEIWKAEDVNLRAMAHRLGRAPSTLMRELRRNATARGSYGAMSAQACRTQRLKASRPTPKLAPDGVLWGVVRHFLDQKWSPQEISATLKRAFPDQRDLNVSHETIYNAIYAYPRGELRRQLIACLRQGHTKRLPRSRGTDRRGQIPDMVSIHVRPPEVNDRLMLGH